MDTHELHRAEKLCDFSNSGVSDGYRVNRRLLNIRNLERLQDLVDPLERLVLPAEDAGLLVDVLLLGDLAGDQLLH